jgi:anaerobic selenocysteine-containing dehydrogenase
MTDWKQTACNLCFVNCGIEVLVGGENDSEIIKVRGDKAHPKSQGYICNKAGRLNYYQNNSARINSPMRRRADGSYEEISWETAIAEIAEKMQSIKSTYGGERIFYYGGGGQGNHLGAAYGSSLMNVLGIKYKANALSQEKTGLSWVFSRMIGMGHHPEVDHAQTVMFVGKNPFMSNGMNKARDFLRAIKKDSNRQLIVIDPRRTETADYADIHLAVKPGRDAWCMAAIIAEIVQHQSLPIDWLKQHTNGYELIIEKFKSVSIADYANFAGIDLAQIQQVAKVIAESESFALEEDIGIQMAPHSTLVSYLNLLLSLITGHFGREGTIALPVQLVNILPNDRIGELDNHFKELTRPRLPVTGAPIYSDLFPGNFLAEEILNDSEERPRAIIIESANPVHSLSEAKTLRNAIRSLHCRVAIDVAMTETASECDYVLPASSQYEKWEATYFPRNFPDNYFHLRPPVFEPMQNTLSEPEIHARLIEALGYFEDGELDALHQAAAAGMEQYQASFFDAVFSNPKIKQAISYVLYRTLGPTLANPSNDAATVVDGVNTDKGKANTAAIWGLCQVFAMKHSKYVAAAGFEGPTAGTDLFNRLLTSPSGATVAVASYDDCFSRIPFSENRLQLVIGELFEELDELEKLTPLIATSKQFEFALVAGSRRAYTANCAIRDPRWAKGKAVTALTMNPQDAQRLGLEEGVRVMLKTEGGQAEADLAYDDRMQIGTVAIPNGQGMRFDDENGEPMDTGVYANELTQVKHRDKFIGTPLHKFVPASVTAA